MDDFERTFTTVLRSAAPAPPTEIDPAEITRMARRGRLRTVGAPLLTALVVAGVIVTLLVALRSGGGTPRQAATPPTAPTISGSTTSTVVSRQPSDLVGSWVLTDLQGFNGVAHTAPDARLTFRIYPNGAMSQGCIASQAIVGTGTLKFVQGWLAGNTYCPHLSLHESQFLLGRVLTGTARWVIRDRELTVHQGTMAAAFQRIGGELTAAQRELAVHIAMTEANTSSASASSTPTTTANRQPGWPSNVTAVGAIITTHADAMKYVGAAGGDTTPVLVIRLVGDFSWITTGPPGHRSATGNVMTIVADAQTGSITDTGLEKQHPPQPLPDATALFPPTPISSSTNTPAAARCLPVNTKGDANAYLGLTFDQALALAHDRDETLISFGGADTCITRFVQPAVPSPVGVVFDQEPTTEYAIPSSAHIVAARVLDPSTGYIFNR